MVTKAQPTSSSVSARASVQLTMAQRSWHHTPSRAILFWLFVSLPLVIWDTGYVLLRPHTMEGGVLHWPMWVPYKLYGEIDHVYGWKAWEGKVGFTAAQGFLNAVETSMYLWYLWVVLQRNGDVGARGEKLERALFGRKAAMAVLIAFSAAVMTLSKTVLYWAHEYFSGFDNIGHNSWIELVFLWIIPNGAWLIFPTYMIYTIGGEIIDGLGSASPGSSTKIE